MNLKEKENQTKKQMCKYPSIKKSSNKDRWNNKGLDICLNLLQENEKQGTKTKISYGEENAIICSIHSTLLTCISKTDVKGAIM